MSNSTKCSLMFEVDHLPINPNLIDKLKKANLLSFKKILNFSQPELQRITKVSAYEANIICQAVSAAEVKSSIVNVHSMLSNLESIRELLSFEFFSNCNTFNGIYTSTITEICGESGSGKTQLCLLLSICSIIPKHMGGLASKVIYIHTEGDFPIQRYGDLYKAFKERYPACKNLNFNNDLILKKVLYLKGIIHVLQNGIPELFKNKMSPKVIIIDSVAALLRSECDSFSLRNLMIRQLATELWKLANVYKMAVICVNQVTGSMKKNDSNIMATDIPSLGLLWSNVLTTRLQISRIESIEESVRRQFEVVFSSYHPHVVIDFLITGKGVEVLNEDVIE